MSHFTADNTFGYEPAGIKLLNKIFDKAAETLCARGLPEGDLKSREDKIAQAVLDVCYEDGGNIDVSDLAAKVLAKLGTPG
jgi:hypothetical protein